MRSWKHFNAKMLHECGYYLHKFAQEASSSVTTSLRLSLPTLPKTHFVGVGCSVGFWDSFLVYNRGTNVGCSWHWTIFFYLSLLSNQLIAFTYPIDQILHQNNIIYRFSYSTMQNFSTKTSLERATNWIRYKRTATIADLNPAECVGDVLARFL